MSKKTKVTKKFSYKSAEALPALKKNVTEWDLKKHYYKSLKDPKLEADIVTTEKALLAFAKKYSSGTWKKNESTVISAIKAYLQLVKLPGETPLYYLFYRRELDASDTEAEKAINKLEARLTKAGNLILFFELELAILPTTMKKKLLTDKRVVPFHYFLFSVFESAQYRLSEPEEKILNLRSMTSRGMWIAATEKILNKKSIDWKGKQMPINSAMMRVETLPRKERSEMWKKIVPVLKEAGEVAENELVALAIDKQVSDELRGYTKPYSATTRNYDSNDETLEKLVSTIETRGYALSRKYYTLRSKLLGRKLSYLDRNEPLGVEPVIPYEEAIGIVRDVFYRFNQEYGRIFDEMLTGGNIDVWPKTGRGGGAFCSSGVGQPTFVFLNQNDSVDSLRTLAHEMGHAVHAYRSKTQPEQYQGHSTLTAETASTFFESLVAEKVIEQATGKDKIILLDSFINNKIGTMIMCIARYKAELEMHETIRTQGSMEYMDMAALLANQFSKYCGKSIVIEPTDGLSIVAKTHYRRNFYQYSYSFGEIGSSVMRSRFYKDATYAMQVDEFLCLGDSCSVEDIFMLIGIDMASVDTFNEALTLLENDIKLLETLTKK